jgi:hypothetical protein
MTEVGGLCYNVQIKQKDMVEKRSAHDTIQDAPRQTTGSGKQHQTVHDDATVVAGILAPLKDDTQGSDPLQTIVLDDDDLYPTGDFSPSKSDLDATARVDAIAQLDAQEWLKQLNERRSQLVALIEEIRPQVSNWAPEFDPRQYIGRYPALSDELVQVVLANGSEVLNNIALREALCIGGEKLRDRNGTEVTIYTFDFLENYAGVIGWGGMGMVKDGYVLKGKKLIRAAIKEPILAAENASSADLEAQNGRIMSYQREAYNASQLLQADIPGVVKCLTVTEPRANGLPVIAYEKVVNRDRKVQNGCNFAADIHVPPSRKLAAMADVIDTVARCHAHSEGFAHCDIKPDNLFMGPDDKLKLGDPGSVTSVGETLTYSISDAHPNKGWVIRNFADSNGNQAVETVALTPNFANVSEIQQAIELGSDIRIADRRALAVTLVDVLQLAHIFSGDVSDWENPAIYQISEVKAALPPAERGKFLSNVLQHIIVLIRELGSIRVPVENLRPLTAIANDLRKCAEQCKAPDELDSVYQVYRASLSSKS